jgi:hypothetical protein
MGGAPAFRTGRRIEGYNGAVRRANGQERPATIKRAQRHRCGGGETFAERGLPQWLTLRTEAQHLAWIGSGNEDLQTGPVRQQVRSQRCECGFGIKGLLPHRRLRLGARQTATQDKAQGYPVPKHEFTPLWVRVEGGV